jgi:hypothetical protein
VPTAYCTVGDVLERLRLPDTDPDAGYIGRCTNAACELIDDYLAGRTEPLPVPMPDSIWRAAVGVSIRIYRFKDVDTDVSESYEFGGSLRIPRDPLAGYGDILKLYRPGRNWAPQ